MGDPPRWQVPRPPAPPPPTPPLRTFGGSTADRPQTLLRVGLFSDESAYFAAHQVQDRANTWLEDYPGAELLASELRVHVRSAGGHTELVLLLVIRVPVPRGGEHPTQPLAAAEVPEAARVEGSYLGIFQRFARGGTEAP